MLRYLFSFVILCQFSLFAQEDLPFQVLVSKNAFVYGSEVKPLQFVDDVTSIDIKDDGFVSLVHTGGTTYELTEKTFTFYLKPEKLKRRDTRPNLDILYADSSTIDKSKLITILNPPFDRSGYLIWNESEPFEFFWHLHDEPVLVYVITVSDGSGKKIQDFRTKHHKYVLKPSTFGLENGSFMIQISSSFGGKTIQSKRYQIQLEKAPTYAKKASDLVIKALDLEVSPALAIETWKELLQVNNGENYKNLYTQFLKRNNRLLTAAGEDVELLLSQNK